MVNSFTTVAGMESYRTLYEVYIYRVNRNFIIIIYLGVKYVTK